MTDSFCTWSVSGDNRRLDRLLMDCRFSVRWLQNDDSVLHGDKRLDTSCLLSDWTCSPWFLFCNCPRFQKDEFCWVSLLMADSFCHFTRSISCGCCICTEFLSCDWCLSAWVLLAGSSCMSLLLGDHCFVTWLMPEDCSSKVKMRQMLDPSEVFERQDSWLTRLETSCLPLFCSKLFWDDCVSVAPPLASPFLHRLSEGFLKDRA